MLTKQNLHQAYKSTKLYVYFTGCKSICFILLHETTLFQQYVYHLAKCRPYKTSYMLYLPITSKMWQ